MLGVCLKIKNCTENTKNIRNNGMRIIGNSRLLYEGRLDFHIIYAIFWHIDEWQAIFKHALGR